MKVDADDIAKLAKAAVDAAKDGVDLNLSDQNAPYRYTMSIFAIGAGFVPTIGPLLGSLAGLIGAVVFPSKTDPNATWNSLREKIEAMIGAQVSASQVKLLRSSITGFGTNMRSYTKTVNSFAQATGDDKAKLGEALRMKHTAFVALLQHGIPQFQIEDWAVPTLPLFVQAANMHVTLLADGINNAAAWGLPQAAKDDFQSEFSEVTLGPARSIRSVRSRDGVRSQRDAVSQAIAFGEAAGWEADLLDTWRGLLTALSNGNNGTTTAAFRKRAPGAPAMTYPQYAQVYYEKGRKSVKAYTATRDNGKGETDACGTTPSPTTTQPCTRTCSRPPRSGRTSPARSCPTRPSRS